ncbi:MAG: tyrosine-type recombinase/integrase [Phycisphaerae bacterium]
MMGKVSRYFTAAEMKALLHAVRAKAARGGLVDKVDHALVVCAWATGCRAGEIASISIDMSRPNHIDTEAGVVVIDEAKWDTKGIVPLDRASLRVLRRYLREVRPRMRFADRSDRLFLTKTGSPYTPNTMSKKLSMLLSRYGFPDKTAHSLRHYCCTDIIRRTNGNISLAKMLMRHRDVRSTMKYDHPSLDDLRGAVNRRSE